MSIFGGTLGGFSSSQRSFYGDIVAAGLTSNLKLVVDVGAAASYTTGQTWSDLSGVSTGFFRGADATPAPDDPVFNGVAGNLSVNEYWSFDGTQFFTYTTSNPSWVNALHKAGAQYSLIVWMYLGSTASESFHFHDHNTTAGDIGVDFGIGSGAAGKQHVNVRKGSAGSALNKSADTAMSTGAWHMLGLSIDEAGGAVSFFYRDGSYDQVSTSNTFNAAYTTPSTSAASNTLHAASNGAGGQIYPNTNRMAGIMAWQGVVLTKANMDTLWASQRTRFGV